MVILRGAVIPTEEAKLGGGGNVKPFGRGRGKEGMLLCCVGPSFVYCIVCVKVSKGDWV